MSLGIITVTSKMKSWWFVFLAYISIATAFPTSPINLVIIGGQNGSINDYPWLVSLYSNDYGFQCGGCLISSSWVMTAAHCINETVLDYARAGSNTTSSDGVVVQLVEKIPHPNYNPVTVDNDIAILRLETPVTGDYIKPIDLPDSETIIPAGDNIRVAGWGIMNNSYPALADTLQEVDLPFIDIEKCRTIYNSDMITDNMLCVGYLNGQEKGTCFGDSGSPLIWNGKPIGIVSWLAGGCASTQYTSVITKVSNYINWIRNITGVLNE